MKDQITLTREEATTVCNAIFRYILSVLDEPAEIERLRGIYDKVAKPYKIQPLMSRIEEKSDLFFENLPKKPK